MDLELESIKAMVAANSIIIGGILVYGCYQVYNWKDIKVDDFFDSEDGGGLDESYVSALDQSFSVNPGENAPTYMLPKHMLVNQRRKTRQQMKQLDITTISSYRPPPISSDTRGGGTGGLNSYNSNQFLSRSSSVSSLGRGLLAFGSRRSSLGTKQDADENDLSEPLNKAIPTEATPNKKDPLFLSKPKGIIELARVLYQIDELAVLKLQNPDGYFYLQFLKRCAWLFGIVTVWNILVVLPSYTLLHNTKFNYLTSDPQTISSTLDQLTIADSLMNSQVVWLAVMVCLLYTSLAYYLVVIKFGQQMGRFEFPPQQATYLDVYVQQHSLMIKGVNPQIGVDEANHIIRGLFESRFGRSQVLGVHTIRRTENAHYLWTKREQYKRMVELYRAQNNLMETRETITLSGFGGFNKQRVDAEKLYLDKLIKVNEKWALLKRRSDNENTGVAFVSFRDKSCVATFMDEIDQFKAKIYGIEKYETVDVMNWEVDEAIPATEIIWDDLNREKPLPLLVRLFLSFICPFILSAIGVYLILYLDLEGSNKQPAIQGILLKYACPLLITVLSFNLLQRYILSVVLPSNRYEKKSKKEENLMTKTANYMILGTLVLPLIACGSISMSYIDFMRENPYQGSPKTPVKQPSQHKQAVVLNARVDNLYNEFLSVAISYSQEYFTRYALQFGLVILALQLFLSPLNLLKALNTTGLKKFKYHAYYSLPFKISVAVSFFTFSLFFCILVPLLAPLSATIFITAYYIDKYNLIYIYPINFESRVAHRRHPLVYAIAGIVLFQLGMFLVATTVLTRRVSIYLFAFLVIQVMILFTTFEFIRKPWEGKEQEYELIINQQVNNLFESISSIHSGDFRFGGGMPVSINDSQLNFRRGSSFFGGRAPKPPQRFKDDASEEYKKLEILSRAYENPCERYFHEAPGVCEEPKGAQQPASPDESFSQHELVQGSPRTLNQLNSVGTAAHYYIASTPSNRRGPKGTMEYKSPPYIPQTDPAKRQDIKKKHLREAAKNVRGADDDEDPQPFIFGSLDEQSDNNLGRQNTDNFLQEKTPFTPTIREYRREAAVKRGSMKYVGLGESNTKKGVSKFKQPL